MLVRNTHLIGTLTDPKRNRKRFDIALNKNQNLSRPFIFPSRIDEIRSQMSRLTMQRIL